MFIYLGNATVFAVFVPIFDAISSVCAGYALEAARCLPSLDQVFEAMQRSWTLFDAHGDFGTTPIFLAAAAADGADGVLG